MGGKLKIALVASEDFFSDYGGGQVYVRNLVDELIQKEQDIVVFSLAVTSSEEPPAGKPDFIRYYRGVPVYQVLSSRFTQSQLAVLLDEIHPDVVHAHGFKQIFAKTCHDLRIPCIITAHHGGILCPQGALLTHTDEICIFPADVKACLPCVLKNIRTGITWWPLLKLLPVRLKIEIGKRLSTLPFMPFVTPIGKASYDISRKIKEWHIIRDNASLFIAPSDAIASSLIRNGARSSIVRVVPHGIPILNIPDSEIITDSKTIRFVFVGRLCREKGVHILLEACSLLTRKRLPVPVELHIIGGAVSSNERRYWKELRARFPIKNVSDGLIDNANVRIVYHGKLTREESLVQVARCDILVHPAVSLEVFGLDIAEAQMLGKPVIATRCGGAEMQIAEDENGWLVSPNRADEFAKAMFEAVSSPGKCKHMAMHSGKRVMSIGMHADALLSIYRKYSE